MSKWVSVWGHAMSRTEQSASGYAKDITLSYPIMMPLDGNEVRLTFDNFTGLEDVKIETEIFKYLMRQHKPMRKELFEKNKKILKNY